MHFFHLFSVPFRTGSHSFFDELIPWNTFLKQIGNFNYLINNSFDVSVDVDEYRLQLSDYFDSCRSRDYFFISCKFKNFSFFLISCNQGFHDPRYCFQFLNSITFELNYFLSDGLICFNFFINNNFGKLSNLYFRLDDNPFSEKIHRLEYNFFFN